MTLPIKLKRGLKANLPSAASAGEPLFTTDTHELFVGTGESVVPIAATDPTLANRVEELEMHRSTVSSTYSEEFDTLAYVDSEKTTAGIVGGRVIPTVTPDFTEDFSTTNYFDESNSMGVTVDTTKRLIRNTAGIKNGIFYAKPITIPNTDKVTINAVSNEPSAYAFSEATRFSYSGSVFSQPMGFTDRTNRTWKVALVNGTGIYAKVTNPDGSLSFEGTILPFKGNTHTLPFQTADYVVDYNNRVWFSISNSSLGGIVGAVNSDGTTFKDWYTLYLGSGTVIATSMTLDNQNRVWVFHSVASYTRLHVFNSDGSLDKDMLNILTSGPTTYLRAVYDPIRNQVAIGIMNGNFFKVYLFDSSFRMIRNIQLTVGGENSSIDLMYDPVLDNYIAIQTIYTSATTSYAVKLYSLHPETLAQTTSVANINAHWVSRLVADGSNYHFVYSSNVELNKFYLATFKAADLSVIDSSVKVSTYAGKHFPFKDSNGVLRSLSLTSRYETNQAIDEYSFGASKATVTLEVTNNNGLEWRNAIPGEEITFQTPSTSLLLRARLDSPTANLSPELYGYRVITGTLTGEVIQEFVSTKIPSVSPIAHASLTADQILQEGSIDWYLSNDGGATWESAVLGRKHSFKNPLYADLRVKAVITSPSGSAKSPAISGYTLTSSNLLLSPAKTGTNLTATMSADQTLSAPHTFTKIAFNTPFQDELQEFDKNLNRFIAKVPGDYLIVGSARIISPTTSPNGLHLEVRINGELHKVLSSIVSYSNHAWCLNGSSIVRLQPGDYVELFGYSFFANGVIEALPAYTYFQIKQLW
jgi:Major tropism determinant N-terminal domain